MKNTSRGKVTFLIAVICTLLAIGLHLYLNKHHIDVKMGHSSEVSMCNISESLNCDTAAASHYAELMGIPMALLGAFTNAFLLLLLVMVHFRWTENTERTERYAFYLSAFIFLTSLVMAGISVFILKTGCPFCMATYVLSFVTIIALWLSFRPALSFFPEDLQDSFSTQKWLWVTGIAAIGLSALVNSMLLDSYGYQQVKEVIKRSVEEWQASPQQNFDLAAGLTFQNGTEAPKATVVEFADFLCSHCKHAYPVLHAFTKAHPDVKLIYKPFPLDGVCNAAIPNKRDGKSCELAYAVLCAQKISQKGWEAHHYIFDNQESIFTTPMDQVTENVCKTAGVDCPQLKTCMNSDEIHELVKKSAAEGEKAQIGGTPAIFYKNKILQGGQLKPVLENAYKML